MAGIYNTNYLEAKQFLDQVELAPRQEVAFDVMTIANMAARYQHAVRTFFQCRQDVHRRHAARTGDGDRRRIGRVLDA